VDPLAPDHHYTGPFADEANPCQCSTVVYSLVSACATCQNRTIEGWVAWSGNCTSVYISQFPEQIPPATAFPGWAYLDVVTSDTFSKVAAEADISAPESSGTATKPTGTVPSTAGTPTATLPLASTPTTGGDGSSPTPTAVFKKSSNAGAIAGGVVGGLVGLGLIAGLCAFFFMRRKKVAPSTAYGNVYNDGPHSDAPLNSPHPMSQHSYSNQTPRAYDPSDPSTYPQSPPTPTVQTTNSVLQPYGNNPGNYNGVPEL